MNRAQRRAEEAKSRANPSRADAIRATLEYLANSTDPTVSGATLMLADGETLYLDAATARAMKPTDGAR